MVNKYTKYRGCFTVKLLLVGVLLGITLLVSSTLFFNLYSRIVTGERGRAALEVLVSLRRPLLLIKDSPVKLHDGSVGFDTTMRDFIDAKSEADAIFKRYRKLVSYNSALYLSAGRLHTIYSGWVQLERRILELPGGEGDKTQRYPEFLSELSVSSSGFLSVMVQLEEGEFLLLADMEDAQRANRVLLLLSVLFIFYNFVLVFLYQSSREFLLRQTRDGLRREVEERKVIECNIRGSRAKVRNLALHLQSVQEEERGRIARDIHDDLGQILTALSYDLAHISKKISPDEALLIDKLKEMSALVKGAVETVQRIASELRPGVLDDLGLIAGIEWQAEAYEKRTGIECEVSFDPEEIELDKDTATTFFRAAQEALTNVARHADATKVTLSIRKIGKTLELEVVDNGRGITEAESRSSQSFGLTGMNERFYSLGGSFEVKGAKGKGTMLRASVPLDNVFGGDAA